MANIVKDHEVQMKQLKGQQRLPTWVVPKHYDLTLNPELSASSFTGSVLIHLSVLDPTRYLVLNSLGLIIHEFSFTTNQLSVKKITMGSSRAYSLRNHRSCQHIWWLLLLVCLITSKIKHLMGLFTRHIQRLLLGALLTS
ncbi:hypothetical protein POM88_032113 [Heracleum sosnowskyi]|uniref:Aminopeptidase N-like N-terminal domain-containing protein n=1 Tax=Heracleum sosnowskyi TaxID=360622 RepID=A0AAD8HZI0_9APIA|nr:hypothetical protein POM88_032113 [Heracleum sosnowskyi]